MARTVEITIEFPAHIWQIVESWLEKYGYSRERFIWVLLALFNAHEQTEERRDLIFITDPDGNVRNRMLLPKDIKGNQVSGQKLSDQERGELTVPLSVEESEFFEKLEAQMKIKNPEDPAA